MNNRTMNNQYGTTKPALLLNSLFSVFYSIVDFRMTINVSHKITGPTEKINWALLPIPCSLLLF